MDRVIRAIPNMLTGAWIPAEERYFKAPRNPAMVGELVEELRHRGYMVQELWLSDPEQVLVERRVRQQMDREAEQKAAKTP